MPRKTRGKTTTPIILAARQARRKPTTAEKVLWGALRNRRLAGLKFRRQHPFDQFILDAFCVEYQLEVEVDGGIHTTPDQLAYDMARTQHLESKGIRVLRFSNDDVLNDLHAALKQIVEATHTPSPGVFFTPGEGEGG